ncbi:UNVERIFIED_CONTAM: hypothetical protein Sindi_1275500 [Sesamum indicum]
MLNAAIWNVRGLNKRDHQLAVKDIIAEFRLQFLGLLETRVRINNVSHIQAFLLPQLKWFVYYGLTSNRVWIAWDDNFIDVDVIECGTQFIHCHVNIRALQESIAITVIYGANEVVERRELWGSLEIIAMQCIDIPWLVGGDFNVVRDLSEICGASGDIRMAMEEFNICIQNAGLLPLPMQGEWYTWHNCSANLYSLGFQEGVLPMRYLGLPLLSSRLTIADCHPLLLKIDKRIAGWERMAISYAGRVQIIKAVHMSLSLYWASAFILPKKVKNEIEKRLRTFLWKGTTTIGYAKVAWKDLCRPKDEGGLGFKNIPILNRAIMMKKLCDIIMCDRTSIWVEWLYEGRLRDTSIWTIREHGGSWSWQKILHLRVFLRPMVDYQIGDGRRFYLWQDPWHYLGPLSDTFPRGPRLLRIEESARLSTVISGGEWQWLLITDFECLEITHALPTIHGGEDRIIWRFEQGYPTSQALYRLIDPPGPKVGWSSLLSGSLKIQRHLFILWLAILGKLATTDKPWLAHLGPCILCTEGAMEWYDFPGPIETGKRMLTGLPRNGEHTESTTSTMALLIVEDIRQRILSISLPTSVGTRALYRLWRIPWPNEGETN